MAKAAYGLLLVAPTSPTLLEGIAVAVSPSVSTELEVGWTS